MTPCRSPLPPSRASYLAALAVIEITHRSYPWPEIMSSRMLRDINPPDTGQTAAMLGTVTPYDHRMLSLRAQTRRQRIVRPAVYAWEFY